MIFISDSARIAGYTSSSRSGKHVLNIRIEYADPSAMGYEMARLDEAMAEQKARDKPAPKRAVRKGIEVKRPLALPAPGGEE